MIRLMVNIAEILFASISAFFWLKSALVKFPSSISARAEITTYPESPEAWDPSDGMIGGEVVSDDLQAATAALHEQGHLNKWAAISTAAAIVMQAVATALSMSNWI